MGRHHKFIPLCFGKIQLSSLVVELCEYDPVEDVHCPQDEHDEADDKDDVVGGNEVGEDAARLGAVDVCCLEQV